MKTTINSNGSKWAGEKPDSIEKLIEVLSETPLDRRFEACGNFAYKGKCKHDREILGHQTRFFGNFLKLSHVFNIDTDNPIIIKKLRNTIRANKLRPDYLSQPKPEKATKALTSVLT